MLSKRSRRNQRRTNRKKRKHSHQKHWCKYQQNAHKHQIF